MEAEAPRPSVLRFLGALPILALLALPAVGLLFAASPESVARGLGHPLFLDAMALSLRTSVLSLVLIIVLGTPCAWWIAGLRPAKRSAMETLILLPIILPPAVVGVGLLVGLGRQGVLGSELAFLGWEIPFTTAAVVVAQVVVSSPFYIRSATAAFRRVDPELVWVARTLGHSPRQAFLRVTLPLAAPGICVGIVLAWARTLGEFGATLIFAGNLESVTQTMPLAIYTALQSDLSVAMALALVLLGLSLALLLGLHLLPYLWRSWCRTQARRALEDV